MATDVPPLTQPVTDPSAVVPTLEEKHPVSLAVEELGQLRKKLTVTVPAERVKAKLDEQLKTLQAQAQVPGFRVGRAPLRLIEKRFGTELREDVRNNLMAAAFDEAVEKNDVKIVGEPEFGDLAAIKLPDDGPMSFTVEVEVKPQFTLPDLKGIAVKKPRIEITDEMVDNEVDRLRVNLGKWVAPAAGSTVQADDRLLCRVIMKAGDKTVEHPGVQLPVRGTSIESVPLPDLGEKLTGRKVGDTVELTGTMPEDAENDFKGQAVTFTITINEIRRFEKPELTAEFVANFGFEKLEDLKAFLREKIDVRVAEMQKQALRGQVVEHLMTQTAMELPPSLSLRQANRTLVREMVRQKMDGLPEAEIDKRMDELRSGAVRKASDDLKRFFILEQIATDRKVEVREEELNAEIARIARSYNRRFDRVRDELARDGSLQYLALQIRENKTLDQLLDDAKVEDVDVKNEAKAGAAT